LRFRIFCSEAVRTAFSALKLLVEQQEWYPACKNACYKNLKGLSETQPNQEYKPSRVGDHNIFI